MIRNIWVTAFGFGVFAFLSSTHYATPAQAFHFLGHSYSHVGVGSPVWKVAEDCPPRSTFSVERGKCVCPPGMKMSDYPQGCVDAAAHPLQGNCPPGFHGTLNLKGLSTCVANYETIRDCEIRGNRWDHIMDRCEGTGGVGGGSTKRLGKKKSQKSLGKKKVMPGTSGGVDGGGDAEAAN